ncbi:MAG TPA: IS4 family transposase [Candidatus Acetothermia bacterium]|nr:IS4 family transposase [Candidatus Acetothermia bacterium]
MFRSQERAFTRRRKLPFREVVVMLLCGWKLSLQTRINRFVRQTGWTGPVPTASAFCQARKKVRPELFLEMNRQALAGLYEDCPESVLRWKGQLLWAVDGTLINLPANGETRKWYSVQRNQYDPQGAVQGMASFLYDVLNEVTVNAVLDKKRSEKSFVLQEHRDHFSPGVIVLYDRLYADYAVMALHAKTGADFVIRARMSQTFKQVEKFIRSPLVDTVVTVGVTTKQRQWVSELGLPDRVQVRLTKVVLADGTVEVLITSLVDRDVYTLQDLEELYKKRWEIETHFDRLKNVFEVERFSSRTVVGIEQDFYGIVLLSTLAGLVAKEEDEERKNRNQRRRTKYVYKVNRSACCVALVDRLVELLLDKSKSLEEAGEELRQELKNALSPVRPGRSFPRQPATASRRMRFLRYQKRLWA